MNISIVVPVYRGEKFIEPLVERLNKLLMEFAENYEVILVNDGSPDRSWEVIECMTKKYHWVRGIRLMRNYGQHNALLCGIRQAKYEVTVTMDQDLQHRPEDIPLLLAEFQRGYDMVYGIPKKMPQNFIRNFLTASIKRMLANVMGVSSVRNISSFRVFHTYLRSAFEDFQGSSLIIDVLLSWGASRFSTVAVDIAKAEASNYDFAGLIKITTEILIGYSTKPLRLASWIGFLMTLFGLGIFVYVLVIYFTVGSLPGFPFLASIIALFSGAQLFALGIFGEYLARMFDRSMARPTYIIHEAIGSA